MTEKDPLYPDLLFMQFEGFREGWQVFLRDFKILVIRKGRKTL